MKYSSPEIATAVIENLDGIEYPQGSGLRLKVCLSVYPSQAYTSANDILPGAFKLLETYVKKCRWAAMQHVDSHSLLSGWCGSCR